MDPFPVGPAARMVQNHIYRCMEGQARADLPPDLSWGGSDSPAAPAPSTAPGTAHRGETGMHVVGQLGGGIWARLQCDRAGSEAAVSRGSYVRRQHATGRRPGGTGPASKGFSCVCRAGRGGTGRRSDSWDKVGLALVHCLETGTELLLSFVARQD